MKRIACLWIPHLVAEVERQRRDLRTGILLVRDGRTVLGSCDRGAALGVRAGDPLHQALARCPQAQVVPADRALYREVWEGILVALKRHSPLVEDVTWGQAYLDAGGMAALYGSEQSWCQSLRDEVRHCASLRALLGVARTRFAAWVAARSSSLDEGYAMVSQDDGAYLSPLSVDWLPSSDEVRRRLHLLGIPTLGQFGALPASAVAEQFGAENLRFHKWARGEDDRPLTGSRRQVWEAHLEFEAPETRLEALLEGLLAVSGEALEEMRRCATSVRRVKLRVQLAEGQSWERSVSVGDVLGPQKLRAALANLLARLGGEGSGVDAIHLALIGLEPGKGRQLNLFAHQDHLHMEETLANLVRKHPSACVMRARRMDSGSPLVEYRYALLECRP